MNFEKEYTQKILNDIMRLGVCMQSIESIESHLLDYKDVNSFDKIAVYQLLDFLKKKGHLSNLSHDAITSFIKHL